MYAGIMLDHPNPDSPAFHDIYCYGASGSHSHTVPSHQHGMDHYHPIDIHLKTSVETGIKLYEKASGVSVKINGTTVVSYINEDIELEISQYLNPTKDNEIEISSETNGYIEAMVKNKYFARF